MNKLVFQSLVMMLALSTQIARAQDRGPNLDQMQVMDLVSTTVNSKFGAADSTISGPDFDQASRAWRVEIQRGDGATYEHFAVSVDEASGVVCVRKAPSNDCAARGDAKAALSAAFEKRKAEADAIRNPPPDLQGVMVAIIRQQLGAGGYLASNRKPLYVALHSPTGDSMVDLSAASIQQLSDTGLELMPGSTWTAPPSGTRVGPKISMGVGTPLRRADGDYDVTFGFYCGGLCGSGHTAVLRHDASGWRVVSAVMNMIS